MSDLYAIFRRQPKLSIAVVGLVVAGIYMLSQADYVYGSMMLAQAAMFVIVLRNPEQRSPIVARLTDLLLLYILGSIVWLMLH